MLITKTVLLVLLFNIYLTDYNYHMYYLGMDLQFKPDRSALMKQKLNNDKTTLLTIKIKSLSTYSFHLKADEVT